MTWVQLFLMIACMVLNGVWAADAAARKSWGWYVAHLFGAFLGGLAALAAGYSLAK